MKGLWLAAFCFVASQSAAWADSFDGSWNGQVNGVQQTAREHGAACPSVSMHLLAQAGTVTGYGLFQGGRAPVHGTVAADGSFSGTITRVGNTMAFNGKFSGDSFSGQWLQGSCVFDVSLAHSKGQPGNQPTQ